MTTSTADIAVFSKDKRPVLTVEVKDTSAYTTPESAAGVRRNLIMHGLLPKASFFMLATPVQLHLWPVSAGPEARPAFTAAARSVLDHYASHRPDGSTRRGGGALEIVIFSWLSNIVSGIRSPSADSDADRMLLESGVYKQIQGGTADFEVQL
jgi:hypothetical protein